MYAAPPNYILCTGGFRCPNTALPLSRNNLRREFTVDPASAVRSVGTRLLLPSWMVTYHDETYPPRSRVVFCVSGPLFLMRLPRGLMTHRIGGTFQRHATRPENPAVCVRWREYPNEHGFQALAEGKQAVAFWRYA